MGRTSTKISVSCGKIELFIENRCIIDITNYMKEIYQPAMALGLLILITLTLIVLFKTYEKDDQVSYTEQATSVSQPVVAQVTVPVSGQLSEAEITGLIRMREEEMLARDVYNALFDKWEQKTFINISSSEQSHTTAIKNLLVQFNIPDPIQTETPGVYQNPAFTDLYNQLVQKGSTSLVDAFTVGATIEDLDIYDLQNLSADTQNADILRVYSYLIAGSENHLRAFTKQLNMRGANYSAQYLTEDEVTKILN